MSLRINTAKALRGSQAALRAKIASIEQEMAGMVWREQHHGPGMQSLDDAFTRILAARNPVVAKGVQLGLCVCLFVCMFVCLFVCVCVVCGFFGQ